MLRGHPPLVPTIRTDFEVGVEGVNDLGVSASGLGTYEEEMKRQGRRSGV